MVGAVSLVLFLGKSSILRNLGSNSNLLPSVGDLLDAFMAVMVFRTCQQVEGGLPADVKSKMMFNIIVDFAIGLVPFLGDIADGEYHKDRREPFLVHN